MRPAPLIICTRQGETPSATTGKLTMLGSNDYLGLAGDERLVRAACTALERFGCGLGMNQPFATTPLHEQLREATAEFTGTEDAALFSSCTAANIALLTTLGGDPESVIVSDADNHASIVDGCRLARARTLIYPPRNTAVAADALSGHQDSTRQILVSDGLFSVEGDVAPAADLARLTAGRNQYLVLDESHAAGVIGHAGRGTAEACSVDPRTGVAAFTGTFAKAFGAGGGGYICGPRDLVDEVRAVARFYIFNTGMHVAAVGAALAGIVAATNEVERLQRLRRNFRRLRSSLRQTGFTLLGGDTPIVPIVVGDETRAARFADELTHRHVVAPLMTHPIVPRGESRVRLQPSARHRAEDIDFAVDQIAAAGRAAGLV